MSGYLKKALIFQSLFFCLLAKSQSLEILSPRPGDAVENEQLFVLRSSGEEPHRMQAFINGYVVAERRQPPFTFILNWNPDLTNHVRFRAYYSEGRVLDIAETYLPVQVDMVEKAVSLQVFPFLEKPWMNGQITVETQGRTFEVETFKPAQVVPCELTLLLDVSGSMQFELGTFSGPLRNFVRQQIALGHRVSVIVFDASPRRIPLDEFWSVSDLREWYQTENQSAVWDSIAAGILNQGAGSRRILYLVSDGADDASIQSPKALEKLLREGQTILCWSNPTDLRNRELTKLVNLSGGVALRGSPEEALGRFETLLEFQMHLVVPDASYPIRITSSQVEFTYPQWRKP